mgnify:CR=1 FL=1
MGQILDVLQDRQHAYESLQKRVIENVMSRVPHETGTPMVLKSKESTGLRFTLFARRLVPSWQLLAVAACVAVCIGCLIWLWIMTF